MCLFKTSSVDYHKPTSYTRDLSIDLDVTLKPLYDCGPSDSQEFKWTLFHGKPLFIFTVLREK